MEAFEFSKLINLIDSILLQDVSTIKTISLQKCGPQYMFAIWTNLFHFRRNIICPLLRQTLWKAQFLFNVQMVLPETRACIRKILPSVRSSLYFIYNDPGFANCKGSEHKKTSAPREEGIRDKCRRPLCV